VSDSLPGKEATERSRLVDRYVAGTMPEVEQEAFEIRMLQDAELAREVELVQRMRAGMQRLSEGGELAKVTARPPPWRALGLAASILLVLGAAFWFVRGTLPGDPVFGPGTTTDSGDMPTFLIAMTRVADEATRLVVPRGSGVVRLSVLPEEAGNGEFATEVRSIGGAAPRTLVAFTSFADRNGFVAILVDAARAEPGRYELVITRKDEAPPAIYPVELRIVD
jgi:hypothetical protein